MKKLKGLLCLGMAALTVLSMSVSANAASTYDDYENEVIEDFVETNFVLVSEEEVVFEDGQVAEVQAFIEDRDEIFALKSGKQKYKCVAKFKNTIGQNVIVLWVEGTFHWDSSADRAYVDNDANGGCSYMNPSFTYVSEEFNRGSDQGGLLWGKKYAYLEFSYVYKNNGNHKNTSTLSFDVNVNGDWHWNTKLETNDVEVIEE